MWYLSYKAWQAKQESYQRDAREAAHAREFFLTQQARARDDRTRRRRRQTASAA